MEHPVDTKWRPSDGWDPGKRVARDLEVKLYHLATIAKYRRMGALMSCYCEICKESQFELEVRE